MRGLHIPLFYPRLGIHQLTDQHSGIGNRKLLILLVFPKQERLGIQPDNGLCERNGVTVIIPTKIVASANVSPGVATKRMTSRPTGSSRLMLTRPSSTS